MKSLSSKRQAFRKELRRNQLDQMFNNKRMQLMKQNVNFVSNEKGKQQRARIASICNSELSTLQKLYALLQLANNINSNIIYAIIGNILIENRDNAISIQHQVLPLCQNRYHDYLLQLEKQQQGYKFAVEKSFPVHKAWLTFLVISFSENGRSQSLKKQYDESIARMILDPRIEVVWYGLSAFESYFFSDETITDQISPKTSLNCYKAFVKLLQSYSHVQTIHNQHHQHHSAQVLKSFLVILQQLAKDPGLFRSLVNSQKDSNIAILVLHMLKSQELRQNVLYWLHQTAQITASKYFLNKKVFEYLVNLIPFTTLQNTQLIFQCIILHIESLDLKDLIPLISHNLQRELIDKLSSHHKHLQFISLKIIHYILLKMYHQEYVRKNTLLFLSQMQSNGFRDVIDSIYHSTNSQEILEIVQWIIDIFYSEQEMSEQ